MNFLIVTSAILFLAEGSVIGLDSLATKEGPCKEQKFLQCVKDFSAGIGVKITKDAGAFRKDLEAAWSTGKLPFDKLCGGTHGFQKCTYPTEWECIGMENLISVGLTDASAREYRSYAASFGYECSPEPYKVISSNMDCVGSVFMNKKDKMDEYYQEYTANLVKDPTHICKYTQDYATKFSGLYSDCGAKPLVATMCKALRAGTLINAPHCDHQVKC